MRDDLPAGTVSLLLTDIEGSTRLLHRLGSDGYAAALDTHRRLLREAFDKFNGVEVDTQGDAFFVAFARVGDALRCAAAAQRALQTHDWAGGNEVRVRMGLHTGEPQPTEEGYVGLDVHLAARIAAVGHGSQVLMSHHTADLARSVLAEDGLILRDLGEHALKDVGERQHLFQLVQPGLRADFSELRSLAGIPNNLPNQATAFVGREQLIESLRDLMLKDDVRVVTITGPGGAGKSRSSVRVARELLQHFPDGAFFIPLAAITDPEDVIPTIALTLKVAQEPGATLYDALRRELSGQQLLLVIDNFEQVQSAARDISQLLKDCPRVKAIVTSREMLRLSGERVFPMPPLSMPPADKRLSVADILRYEAIALFVDRAKSARPDFVVEAGNVADVIEICAQLDALPLAIELAAARIQSMAPERLLRALRRRLKVLTGGAVDLLDHQRTLRDLIAWSYDLLADDEKTLWRRLAVFVDGATVEAAQAVCDLDGEIEVELDVDTLVAKSLVRMDFDASASGVDKVIRADHAQPRIALLQTLRDFALEVLESSGELNVLAERHRNYFLALSEPVEHGLRGDESAVWVRRFRAELPNLRAAFESLLAVAPEGALELAANLWLLFYRIGHLLEGEEWLDTALGAASGAAPGIRARAHYGLASLHRHQGHLEIADEHCSTAIDLYRSAGERHGEAIALAELGAIAERMGDNERASELLEAAVPLMRELEDLESLAFALVALGALHYIEGEIHSAHACYAESRDIARARGDKHGVATASVNLGEVEQLRGDPAAAAELYKQSLAIFADLDLTIAIAYCLEVLAPISLELGDPATAAVLFGHAHALRESIDAPVESFNLERYQHDVELVRTALSDADFNESWRRGLLTPTNEIVADALGIQVAQLAAALEAAIGQRG